jgi:hypothetical protein
MWQKSGFIKGAVLDARDSSELRSDLLISRRQFAARWRSMDCRASDS